MRKNTRRFIAASAALAVVAFAILNVLAYNHARTMTHYSASGARTTRPEDLSFMAKAKVLLTGVNLPRPISNRTPADLDGGTQAFFIQSTDGAELVCWYCSHGEGAPLVILFHGYGAEKASLLPEAKAFLDLGTSVLLVDFRGSGESSESYTTLGLHEADDVAAVVHYVEEHLPHSGIILFGQSMGSVAILRAVHEHGVSPDAVILESVFDSLLNTVRNRFRAMHVPSFPNAELLVFWSGRQWGFNAFRHNPVDYAASLHCPALFMHGADDPRATLSDGRRVFEASHGPKEFVTFDRTGHESHLSREPEKWRMAVSGFTDSFLSPTPRPQPSP